MDRCSYQTSALSTQRNFLTVFGGRLKSYEQECIFKCEDFCTCKCMPSLGLLQNLSLKDVLSNSFCVENREILDAVRAPVSQLEKIRKSDCFKLL
jgi:hypothetical protein